MSDVPTVTLADIEAAREVLAGVAIQTPMEESRWLSALAGGPVSASSARTSSAPGRSRPAAPTSGSPGSRRRSAPTAWSRRPPATTPRASRSPRSCSASSPPCSCPRARRSRRRRRPGRTAPTWSSTAATSRTRSRRRRRSPAETGAVLIHPFDHVDIVAGQGTVGLEILEQAPGRADRAGADRRRRPARRDRDRGQGAAARRPRDRRAGRGRRGVPRLARARAPGPAGVDEDDGRRHRGRPPRRHHVRRRPRPRRRDRHGLRGLAVAGAAGPARAGQDGRRAGRGGRGRGDARRPGGVPDADGRGAVRRQHRPAAARQGDPARHGRGRALPQPAGLHPRRARRAGRSCSARSARSARTCSRSCTSGSRPSLHLDEVEVHLQLETRGEPHAEQVLARLRERGYRVFE